MSVAFTIVTQFANIYLARSVVWGSTWRASSSRMSEVSESEEKAKGKAALGEGWFRARTYEGLDGRGRIVPKENFDYK